MFYSCISILTSQPLQAKIYMWCKRWWISETYNMKFMKR